MRVHFAIAAAALGLFAIPASAQEEAVQERQEDETAEPAAVDSELLVERDREEEVDPDEVVCRRTQPQTGSRLRGRRTCKTNKEWEMDRIEAEQFMNEQTRYQMGAGVREGSLSD
ncbi:hypothetical protein GCM10023208_09440 [Erythrobacter westpacificensis]|uniref:Uncharacterized protein n=1 Tax=Erythrobacter westpacificensis TaxID=1055231 RepID=A0ABP9K6I4_9SPHN